MQLHFFGAAQEVTGSCFMLETSEARVLVDCGLFQGEKFAEEKNYEHFPFDPTHLDAVIVTHSHLDHCGRVPKLTHEGYRGAVYMTPPTRELSHLMWQDAANIMRERHEHEGDAVLYHQEDIEAVHAHCKAVEYGEWRTINSEISFRFHEAGHILGSAWVELRVRNTTIVFSGDIGNDDLPIVRDTAPITQADYIVLESTYGDRLHNGVKERAKMLRKVVIESVKRGGALLIPAFSLERTQEILYELNQLIDFEHALPRMPIFLDSPLAIKATAVYKEMSRYYDRNAKELKASDGDLFNFSGLHATRTVAESKTINTAPNPKIIIAGSGMMNGGRIMHHVERYLSDPKSTLLIVSYQAEGTLGRKISGGAKVVTIRGKQIPVAAHLERIEAYSAHGDQNKLVRWAAGGVGGASRTGGARDAVGIKHIFTVHGDAPAVRELALRLGSELGVAAHAPRSGETFELD